MSRRHELFNYVESNKRPAFVKVALEKDGGVTITVREQELADDHWPCAAIKLDQATFKRLLKDSADGLAKHQLKAPKLRKRG